MRRQNLRIKNQNKKYTKHDISKIVKERNYEKKIILKFNITRSVAKSIIQNIDWYLALDVNIFSLLTRYKLLSKEKNCVTIDDCLIDKIITPRTDVFLSIILSLDPFWLNIFLKRLNKTTNNSIFCKKNYEKK